MKCYIEYTDEEVKIREQLEKEWLRFADGYKIHEWDIPALLEEEILKKCGYFINVGWIYKSKRY